MTSQSPRELEFRNSLIPSGESLEAIYAVEAVEREEPQINPEMEHLFHAGMYARTCRLPAGVRIVSVLYKIPTLLIINGGCLVFSDRWYKIEDYQVIAAPAGRKLIYVT